jgi:PGF-CTERM protein
MAHTDSDGDETYDFVESEGSADGPYVANGAPVMSSATVDAPVMTTETMETTEMMEPTEAGDTTDGESGGSVPGFGIGIALVALLGAALLAVRQQ